MAQQIKNLPAVQETWVQFLGRKDPLVEPVQNGELLFQKFQVEVDFEIIIIDDELPEIEEIFYINLTSVEIQGLPKFDANWRPRLNQDFSVAVITILDNDDLAGTDTSFAKTAVTTAVDTARPRETDSVYRRGFRVAHDTAITRIHLVSDCPSPLGVTVKPYSFYFIRLVTISTNTIP